jgi:hypothetical protein
MPSIQSGQGVSALGQSGEFNGAPGLALQRWYDAARNITSTFMAPQTVISLVIIQVISWCGSYLLCFPLALHFPPAISVRGSQISINFLSPASIFFLNSSPSGVEAMPHERGKPKRGSIYYSLVGRHRHTGPPSLSPNPGSSSVSHPYSDQSWRDDAQPTPQLLDPELNYGGCIVEEEIPPNWEEDITEQTTPTRTALPLNYPDIAMGGCVVEEEIPPQKQDDFMQGAVPISVDRTMKPSGLIGMTVGQGGDPSEAAYGEPTHPALASHDFPSPHRLTEDHLNLIFEMRRDMADQLHSHVPSVDVWICCLIPCQASLRRVTCPTCCQHLPSPSAMMEV